MDEPVAQGRRIGFDFGDKRIGVATSDHRAILVSPHATIINDQQLSVKLEDIFKEIDPIYVVIGDPRHLSGSDSAKSLSALEFGLLIKKFYIGPIYLVDERMSTNSAYLQMRQLGKNEEESKGVIDQIAAVIILESALLNEKSGTLIGRQV